MDGPDIAWRADIGIGYAAVSVADGRVYAMGHENGKDVVRCLDEASGETLWADAYKAERYDKHPQNEGGPSATPTVDGERVYTLSKGGRLRCYDAADGAVRWVKHLPERLGVEPPTWGYSGSPLVEGEKLILGVGPVVAVNKRNGEVLWRTEDFTAGYSSPVGFTVDGERLVVVFNAYGAVVVRADTGEIVAKRRWETDWGVNAATPIVLGRNNRFLFISSDYGKGCALFKLTAGELQRVWKNREMNNHFNGCVAWENYLYGFHGHVNDGTLKCLDARTGEVAWARGDLGTGAQMVAAGKLIILTKRGRLIIAEASPSGFRPLAQAQVLGGQCWTMPVLANGRIYCRNNDQGRLVAVDVRPDETGGP